MKSILISLVTILLVFSIISCSDTPSDEELIKLKEGYIYNLKAGCFQGHRSNKELKHLTDKDIKDYCQCVGDILFKVITLEEMEHFSTHMKMEGTQKEKYIKASKKCNE